MIANTGLYCASGELLEEFGKKKKLKKNIKKTLFRSERRRQFWARLKKTREFNAFLKLVYSLVYVFMARRHRSQSVNE